MNLTFVSDNGTTWTLDGDLGVQLVDQVDGLTTTTVDLTVENRVGADGGVLISHRRPPQRVVVDLLVADHVPSVDRLAQWSEFQAAAHVGGKLVFAGSSGTRELRNLVLESTSRNMLDPLSDQFTSTFVALDPWWYGQAVTESFVFAAPTGWDDPIAWDSPIPWNGGAAAQVTVQGHGPAFPLWTITGAITELIVGGGTQQWTWTYDLTTGAYGTVDHRPGSKSPRLGSTLHGVAESGFGLWSLLSNSSTLDWGLAPGVNDLIVSAAGTDGSSALELWYEPKWLSPG